MFLLLNMLSRLVVTFASCDGPRRSLTRGATPRPRSGAVAERSYPTSEVRGGGLEELPHARGQGRRPGGAMPRPRSGAVAGRSYPMPEARGSGLEELPHARGQGRWLGGATPGPRSGAAAESARLRRRRSSQEELPRPRPGVVAGRSYTTPEARGCSREALPRARGQGRLPRVPGCDGAVAAECQAATVTEWLRGATPGPRPGAAAGRRYPTPEARVGGLEELPHAQGHGCQPGGATPRPRTGAAAWRSYPTPEDRGGGLEELPQA